MDGDGVVDIVLGTGNDVNRILYNNGYGDFSRRAIQYLPAPVFGGPHIEVKPDGTFYSDGQLASAAHAGTMGS